MSEDETVILTEEEKQKIVQGSDEDATDTEFDRIDNSDND